MGRGRPKISTEERTGKIRYNIYGSKMIVEEYKNPHEVTIRFLETNEKATTQWRCFRDGIIRSKFDKTVYGIGYIGVGEYKAKIKGKITNQYKSWYALIQRCYDEKRHEKEPTYKECRVCDEWLNFQTFAKWYDENFYQIENEKMNLDKDILVKGNKLYSPETCVFVPQIINTLFIKCDARRGSLPIGVSYNKNNKKYMSQCSDGMEENKYIGYFDTIDEAFQRYKINKEKIIKNVAEKYKDNIPKKLYDAMMIYEVSIYD
jgi:hypothetical protein